MKKRNFTREFKAKLVFEALREERSLSEIAAEHELSPNQLGNWKREFLECAGTIFDESKDRREFRKACQQADSEKSAC